MSILDGTGISSELYTPVWATNSVLVRDDLHNFMTQFSKDEAVNGGYLSASFAIEEFSGRLATWLYYLGYDFKLYGESQQEIWNGFVNELTISTGKYTFKVGPLLNVANDVDVQYQTMSYNTNPPIGGNGATTGSAVDTTSQGKYGTLETILSGGQGLAADITQLRDTYLNEFKNPETTQTINIGGQGGFSVSVSLLGYYHLLDRFYFSQSATGTQNADAKIKAILAAHPTLTFDVTAVESNTLQVPQFSDGSKKGSEEIRNIVAKGDSSDQRYQFGTYGLDAVYAPISTATDQISYFYTIDKEGNELIEETNGAAVDIWEIKAGKWVTILDFRITDPSTVFSTDLRDDLRNVFVESVSYTAPSSLTITGGKVSKLSQKLAKLGLGGI